MKRILLVTADKGLKRDLTRELVGLGFDTYPLAPGEENSTFAWQKCPDLILIDYSVNSPSLRSFCTKVKREEQTRGIPLVALIPEAGVQEFDLWDMVEDFIVMPCRYEELGPRIQQIQRRNRLNISDEGIRIGELFIDFVGYEVLLQGAPVALTYKEYELLKFLVRHPNRVFSRHALLRQVWGYDAYVGTRTVDIHIRRLRSKLGEVGSGIQTVRNVGYKFNLELFTHNLPS